ncbi:hypothetical protein [Pseudozobellia thermophila]|uniref:Lipoprotein n=1 Tax=Pseudozobellia thermophila TaxID=192903 RepID=A0A1M6HIK3_9FLAO|nr:hypothetical protein [Pseudozobellia thermophila]SHJ22046.1 hypothetical protein SAMN04488513_10365 [Pseudozobellia thermophila]
MKNSNQSAFKTPLVLFLFLTIMSCNKEKRETVRVEEPKKMIIPIDEAKELYDTYGKRRVGLIRNYEDSLNRPKGYDDRQQDGQKAQESSPEEAASFVPTRYVEFDFQELQNYMKFIEQEAGDAHVDITNLRVYLTNYPNKKEFKDGRKVKNPRRNSVMMVPTVKRGDKDFAFYTADDSKDGRRKAFLLNEDLEDTGEAVGGGEKEKASLIPTSMPKPLKAPLPAINQQSLYGNEGGLRPPS